MITIMVILVSMAIAIYFADWIRTILPVNLLCLLLLVQVRCVKETGIEVLIAGYQKKNAVLSDQEKKVVAYHEIGHALVAALQSHSAPGKKFIFTRF